MPPYGLKISNSGHVYSNSYVLLNSQTNECLTFTELPRSICEHILRYSVANSLFGNLSQWLEPFICPQSVRLVARFWHSWILAVSHHAVTNSMSLLVALRCFGIVRCRTLLNRGGITHSHHYPLSSHNFIESSKYHELNESSTCHELSESSKYIINSMGPSNVTNSMSYLHVSNSVSHFVALRDSRAVRCDTLLHHELTPHQRPTNSLFFICLREIEIA